MSGKMPPISADRLDNSPVISNRLGYSKKDQRVKAFLKNKEATINTALRMPESVYNKLKILKIYDDRSINAHIVKALEQYLKTPIVMSAIKRVTKKMNIE